MDNTDPPREGKHRNAGGRMLALAAISIILLPMLYLLSVGPVAYLNARGEMSDEAVVIYYSPLLWLGDQSERFKSILDAYTNWWFDLAHTPVPDLLTPSVIASTSPRAQQLAEHRTIACYNRAWKTTLIASWAKTFASARHSADGRYRLRRQARRGEQEHLLAVPLHVRRRA